MIVYPVDQKVKVQIGDATFWVTPLTVGQKADLLIHETTVAGETKRDGAAIMRQALKYALKGCEGIQMANGEDYQLTFDADGYVADHCIDTLLTASTNLMLFAARLPHGVIPDDIKGVKVSFPATKKKKSKKTNRVSA